MVEGWIARQSSDELRTPSPASGGAAYPPRTGPAGSARGPDRIAARATGSRRHHPSPEVAIRLRVAPSTVSNLVRAMTAAGLVRRKRSTTDLRNVYLSLSPAALETLDRYDRGSTAALRKAIDRLSPQRLSARERALPALADLTHLAPGRAGRASVVPDRQRNCRSPIRRPPGQASNQFDAALKDFFYDRETSGAAAAWRSDVG